MQEQISGWEPIEEVNVFGVKIEGTEGRAGMAALVLAENQSFDADSFRRHVEAALPGYARPVFVRINKALETTGTFKLKKRDLQKEGIESARIVPWLDGYCFWTIVDYYAVSSQGLFDEV